jgi:hypothetical protein
MSTRLFVTSPRGGKRSRPAPSELDPPVPMSKINDFLRQHELSIAQNPCISPDFCLDWPRLSARLSAGEAVTRHALSEVQTELGSLTLCEDAVGDHAWLLHGDARARALLAAGVALPNGDTAFPATWQNLLRVKNLIQEHDPRSTVFPSASGTLAHSSLGVGARFTTLHWPAVEWAMAELGLSMTANQNSIPRELVYDVDAMLEHRLAGVPFPFIGCDVPEGHQGQSVEGMSHGSVLSKLETGFHRRQLAWGFNADHQPIGGNFDAREAELVRGCLLASYITFDLSPELAANSKQVSPTAWCAENVPGELVTRVRARLAALEISSETAAFAELLAYVWPAILKLQRRDHLYAQARREAFTTPLGQSYFRELSLDELPGLTTPETLATMLAFCEALDLRIHYVAPAFGFQRNSPFDDNLELERRVKDAWRICEAFGVSIGFHSGSGKSAENYRLCGRVTGCKLEIKTSGRYTYELGRALKSSSNARDLALWHDWYAFTRELAVASAFSTDEQECGMARRFIVHALTLEGRPSDVFSDRASCEAALAELSPSPDHMFWFEYNFLYDLAAEGSAAKSALGDHTQLGYDQRARFYAVSEEGHVLYAKNVIEYLCFLAETTGMASAGACQQASRRLASYTSYAQLLAAIAPS